MDRFATSVERAIASHDAEIAEFRQFLREMIVAVDRASNLQTETFAIVREMQAEVRGLQTENRRILDQVFGEDSN